MKKSKFESFVNEIMDEFPSDLSSKNKNPYKNKKAQSQKKRHEAKKTRKRTANKNTSFQGNNNKNKNKQKAKEPNVTYAQKLNKETKEVKDPRKINLTRDEMRKAIIYSEILGKPKSLR